MDKIYEEKRKKRGYYQTEQRKNIGILAMRKYRQTEKGKLNGKTWTKIQKEKGYPFQKKYMKNHPEVYRKSKARYYDENGYFELWDSPFPKEIKIHHHHVNNLIVIPIPDRTHFSSFGKNHKRRCNEMIEKIYCINLERLLCP